MNLNLTNLEQLCLAVHEHQYGATLYLFRWLGSSQAPLVWGEEDAVWLAEQLELDFEPDLGEFLTCFPLSEINNLDCIPAITDEETQRHECLSSRGHHPP
jgi:hypothetical protein